jgi:hypothetical protein
MAGRTQTLGGGGEEVKTAGNKNTLAPLTKNTRMFPICFQPLSRGDALLTLVNLLSSSCSYKFTIPFGLGTEGSR